MQIQNQALRLSISEDAASYQFECVQFPQGKVTSSIAVQCNLGSSPVSLLNPPWDILHKDENTSLGTPIGEINGVCLTLHTPVEGVLVRLCLGLSSEVSMAFIRLEIVNDGSKALEIERLTLLDISPGEIQLNKRVPADPVFFSNGWQSWSSSGSYRRDERQRISRLGPFQNPMVVNPGTPQMKGPNRYTGDMFGVFGDRATRIGFLPGFLAQKQQFGSLEAGFQPAPYLKMWANGDRAVLLPGQRMPTDWAVLGFINLDGEEPIQAYLKAVADAHCIQSIPNIPPGWCSWYHFYEDITQENINANLDAVISEQSNLPLKLFQIDDGFETQPGDWFDFDPAFPAGLAPIAEKIKSANLMPGVWLAPFIVHPKADLVRKHPDWLLCDAKGKPVRAGFVWNNFTYALDLTHPEALDYACRVIQTAVENWGFEYLKLDFLYAAALEGAYHNNSLTRAQVLRRGLEALRNAAGDNVLMLACGCPLGSALGLFEAMRISADVSGRWQPHFPPVSCLLKNEPHMPSARNALQNILSRAMLHRRWWFNDPDCLLVREDTQLSLAEVQTLTTAIGLTGGSLLLSDDLPSLSQDRLKMAQTLLPLICERPRIIDWIDRRTPAKLRLDLTGPAGSWSILAMFNWVDNPAELTFTPEAFQLPEGKTWMLREFWTGQIEKMGAGKPVNCIDVPPHGVRVMAARLFHPEQPAYLGGQWHLSQGMELDGWKVQEDSLSLDFSLGRDAAGKIFLYLPWEPSGALFKNKRQALINHGEGIFSLHLENPDGHSLLIKK